MNHIYNTNTWVVSEKWFKAQSTENQKHILEAARAAIIYSRGVAAHLSELAVDESKEHGMKFNYISLKNMTKLKKMAQVGYRKWAVDDFGLKAELLDSVDNEVALIQKVLGNNLLNRYAR